MRVSESHQQVDEYVASFTQNTVIRPEKGARIKPEVLNEWLRKINRDAALTAASDLKIAVAIWLHINRTSGKAWPSISTIAHETALHDRTVYRALERLEARGHLLIDHRGGRSNCNDYRLNLGAQTTENGDNFDRVKPSRNGDNLVTETVTALSPNPDNLVTETLTSLSSEPLSEPFIGPLSETTSPSLGDSDPKRRIAQQAKKEKKADSQEINQKSDSAGFEEWWRQYPRKVAKAAARTAYLRAVKSGKATPAELLTGVMRYAAERHAAINMGRPEEYRFTKHPATWLRAECWTDEPGPAASTPAPSVGLASFAEGIRRNIERNMGGS
jgi:hypothetical protein